MTEGLTEQIKTSLHQFSTTRALFSLVVGDDHAPFLDAQFLVEAYAADELVQGIPVCDVIAISTNAQISLGRLLGTKATLEVSLANGTRTRLSGDISQIAQLGSDGALARYRLRLSPWLHRLAHVRNSRAWQDKSVVEIVDSVFARYLPLAIWRCSDEVAPFMAAVPARSYCCQYRESDLDFVRRLLTEEGLSWRFEQTEAGAGLVLFADSTQASAVPADPCSAADGGIRFHDARAGERQDTVQALTLYRTLTPALTSTLSYDYKTKKAVAASAPSHVKNGAKLPTLESFDVPGQYAFANAGLAERYATLQMEGHEARAALWRGRSTVRTLRAGTRLSILDAPLRQLGQAPAFAILRVTSVGVNNLPLAAQSALTELFGSVHALLKEHFPKNLPDDFALVIEQARKSGYANCFEAMPADVVLRPQLPDSAGRRHHRPTAPGSQSAIVVGAEGDHHPAGADELYCDRLGRVRIRFHWQSNSEAACWVRVAQRSAGGGMGSQFLPRIGQEVLVQFLDGDIDRPVVVGAMYNGQGEGGVPVTPGGHVNEEDRAKPFDAANDVSPSGSGNFVGGNSPLWHGASAENSGHRNGAGLWGIRSKEFGASGYSPLLFVVFVAQGRVQLKCTHAASEMNLGHLIHCADNYRGSFRGLGAELRTDDYGAVRAGAGLLISSYQISHTAENREPAGDNGASIAMLKRATITAAKFNDAAKAHKTAILATHVGAHRAGESVMSAQSAPLEALLMAVSGMVGSERLEVAQADALKMTTEAGDGMLPHGSAPVIAMAAKAGLAVVAGQGVQLANGETVTLMSGGDTQFSTGGKLRGHTRQTIGVLGGAAKAGEGNMGMQCVAAKGKLDLQAQAGMFDVQARDEVSIVSANAHIDWAAAKRISLSTAGGANITIEGGSITIQCPGKILVHAGKKTFSGPARLARPMPELPRSICVECLRKSLAAAPAFTVVG